MRLFNLTRCYQVILEFSDCVPVCKEEKGLVLAGNIVCFMIKDICVF